MKLNRIWELLDREQKIELPLWIWLTFGSLTLWGMFSFWQIGASSLSQTYGTIYLSTYNWLLGEPIWVSQLIDIGFLIALGWAVLYAFLGDHE